MVNPNRFGRRNVGSVNSSAVSRNSRLNSGLSRPKTQDPRLISRGGFIRGAGIVAGSALAAGLGFGGVAKAAPTDPWPVGDANPDPMNIVSNGNGGWIVYPIGSPDVLKADGTFSGLVGAPYNKHVFDHDNFTVTFSVDPPDSAFPDVVYKINPYSVNPLGSNGSLITQDSRNIQWAVANGDASIVPKPQVLLKAKKNDNVTPMYFNFLLNVDAESPIEAFRTHAPIQIPVAPGVDPPPICNRAASVGIYKSVEIVGELMSPYSGTFPGGETPGNGFIPDRTMIYGGESPFTNDYPGDQTPAPNISIKKIYFAYPSRNGVCISYSSGIEVSDCVIYDLFGAEEFYYPIEFFGYKVPFRLCMGIEVAATFLIEPFKKPNPFLFGNCTITNNRIKRRTETVEQTPFGPMLNYGFVDIGIFTQLSDMTIIISNNEVKNFPNSGIIVQSNTGTTEVTNNKVYNCSFQGVFYPIYFRYPVYESAGIGVRGNMAPLHIASNYIECGYEYSENILPPEIPISGKTQHGIMLSGASNTIVENNTIKNDSYLQGEAGVSISAIFIEPLADYGGLPSQNNKILRNNATGLISGMNQVQIGIGCDGNTFQNNDYGAIFGESGILAGAFISSNGNTFVNENFWGNYTGINGTPVLPCMWFASGALNNSVSALKNGQALQGLNVCNQIYFETGTEPPTNTVNGYSKCAAIPQAVRDEMAARKAAFIERKKAQCKKAQGTWNEATQTCDLSKYPL